MQLFFLVLKLVNKNKGQDKEKGSKLQVTNFLLKTKDVL